MLTSVVGLDGSGNNNTRKPLLRRYSVIPSTVASFSGARVEILALLGSEPLFCADSGSARLMQAASAASAMRRALVMVFIGSLSIRKAGDRSVDWHPNEHVRMAKPPVQYS